MGWESCSSWTKKDQVVQELSDNLRRSGFEIKKEKTSADGVWYVAEKDSKAFIYFGLIKKEGGEFYLKTMSEDAGPSYYSCPVSFFELCEASSEYSKAWREKVKSNNALKNRKLVMGMRISLYDIEYQVTGDRIIRNDAGQSFKLRPSHNSHWREVSKTTGEIAS